MAHPLNILVLPTSEDVAQEAARRVLSLGKEAIQQRGLFNLILSGGSTPKRMLEILAGPSGDELDWNKTNLHLGDERYLAVGDKDRNSHMVRLTLVEPRGIAERCFWPSTCSGDPERDAREYEGILRANLKPNADLMFLGMGADGHTLSLFPESPALDEAQRWVAVGPGLDPPARTRITTTYPFLSRVDKGIFLVTGADKADRLLEIWDGAEYPARRANDALADCDWILDEAAASRLPR